MLAREEPVEGTLDRGVRHRLRDVGVRRAELAERLEHRHALVRVARVHTADDQAVLVVDLRRQVLGSAGNDTPMATADTSSGAASP